MNRGKMIHEIIRFFYTFLKYTLKQKLSSIDNIEEYYTEVVYTLYELIKSEYTYPKKWENSISNFLDNFVKYEVDRFNQFTKKYSNRSLFFQKYLWVQNEVSVLCESLKCRGVIDFIFLDINDELVFMDFKTNDFSEENRNYFRLQLLFYALIYFTKYNKIPKYLTIFFIKINKITKELLTIQELLTMKKLIASCREIVEKSIYNVIDIEKCKNCNGLEICLKYGRLIISDGLLKVLE